MAISITNHLMQWITGQLITSAELAEEGETTHWLAGSLADILLGAPSLQGGNAPLQVTAAGGLNVTVGGLGQQFVLGRRVVNEMGTVGVSFPSNTGSSPRTDIIVGQPLEVQGDPFTTQVRNSDRTISSVTAYKLIQGASILGLAGPGATVPTGYTLIATVQTPTSNVITNANITINLPTFSSLVNALISAAILASLPTVSGLIAAAIGAIPAGVTSYNGATGAVTGVSTFNGATGAVTGVSTFNGSAGAVTGVSTFNGSAGAATGVASYNGATGPVTGLSAATSADGSVVITGSGPTRDYSIAKTGAYAAGLVQYRFRYNYGANSGSLMPTTQSSIVPLGSTLGAFQVGTGAPNSTVEGVFNVTVKAGSGAQPIGSTVPSLSGGGGCNEQGGYVGVFLDGTLIASQSSPTGTFSWSGTIPDDGSPHTVVLHVNANTTAGLNCLWSAWLPQNAYGGLDTSKIASVVPGA